jgi:hypothetical protein
MGAEARRKSPSALPGAGGPCWGAGEYARVRRQLGFMDLLADADTANRQRQLDKATGHLPGTMQDALPFYRGMIDRHHAAMLAADIEEAMSIREEAHDLAVKLNGGNGGILAGPDAPGSVLERETAAAPGTVPLWGQAGAFKSPRTAGTAAAHGGPSLWPPLRGKPRRLRTRPPGTPIPERIDGHADRRRRQRTRLLSGRASAFSPSCVASAFDLLLVAILLV